MIVKNESHVIERCLKSVLPYITGYMIVDTGSTDDTMNIIRRTLEPLPGEVVSHPWVDFSHNRNVAIDLAKGKSDYLLTMDADETIGPGVLPDDIGDGLILPTHDTNIPNRYARIRFFKNDGSFCYTGKIHEALIPLRPVKLGFLQAPVFMSHYDSNRNLLGDKNHRDLKVLLNEPPTARNLFFLGQTYMNLGRWEEAIYAYSQRAALGGSGGTGHEEVYISLLHIAKCLNRLNRPDEALGYLFRAHAVIPKRYEALDMICRYLLNAKQYELLAQLVPDEFPQYQGLLFTDDTATLRLRETKASLLDAIGRKQEAADVLKELASEGYWTPQQMSALKAKIAKLEE